MPTAAWVKPSQKQDPMHSGCCTDPEGHCWQSRASPGLGVGTGAWWSCLGLFSILHTGDDCLAGWLGMYWSLHAACAQDHPSPICTSAWTSSGQEALHPILVPRGMSGPYALPQDPGDFIGCEHLCLCSAMALPSWALCWALGSTGGEQQWWRAGKYL